MKRPRTVEVPLPVLLAIEDELADVADLVRLAAELDLAVRGLEAADERLRRVIEVAAVAIEEGALADLLGAPETLLTIARGRVERVRAVVARVAGRER